mmetsp:Transcript_20290/g.61861  ORF Transcript_20290/g.61861 Transcript_20290/m.61861 type:complete len:477 (+) Transcript_20290:705-2135(+)
MTWLPLGVVTVSLSSEEKTPPSTSCVVTFISRSAAKAGAEIRLIAAPVSSRAPDWSKRPTSAAAAHSSPAFSTLPDTCTCSEVTAALLTCASSLPRDVASAVHGFSSGFCERVRLGALTTPTTGCSAKAATSEFAISSATLPCASSVEAPRCGVATSLGCSISAHSCSAGGSDSNTSTAAPATWPDCSAASRSASLMMPPRAQLMMRTPGFIVAIDVLLIMSFVSSSSGTWTVRKSARAMQSAAETGSMLSLREASGGKKGSYPITSIPYDCMREITSRPTRPRPSTPSVLPESSTPMYFFRSHLRAFIDASPCATLRASEAMRAHVCSAAETVLPPGVFMTMMPFLVAATQSMLSTPVPARPIAVILCADSMISAVTVVPERTIRPSYSPMIFLSSAGGTLDLQSTTTPAFCRMSTHTCSIGSEMRTFLPLALAPPCVRARFGLVTSIAPLEDGFFGMGSASSAVSVSLAPMRGD